MSSTHLSEIDDPTDIGLIRTVLRSAGFRGSHAVADSEEKRAALTFSKWRILGKRIVVGAETSRRSFTAGTSANAGELANDVAIA
ncbi:hypothetical protein ACU8MG_13440 [Rhizobium leguminosarum]